MLIDLVVVDHSRDFCSALDAELRDARNACSAPVAVRVLCGDLSSSFGVATASDESIRGYGDLVGAAFGRRYRIAVDGLLVVYAYGACVGCAPLPSPSSPPFSPLAPS